MATVKSDSVLQSERRGGRFSSFLVRCWVEGGNGEGGIIRGTILNLTTGGRTAFINAACVGDRIMRELGADCGKNPGDRGIGGSVNDVVPAGCRAGRDGQEGGVES